MSHMWNRLHDWGPAGVLHMWNRLHDWDPVGMLHTWNRLHNRGPMGLLHMQSTPQYWGPCGLLHREQPSLSEACIRGLGRAPHAETHLPTSTAPRPRSSRGSARSLHVHQLPLPSRWPLVRALTATLILTLLELTGGTPSLGAPHSAFCREIDPRCCVWLSCVKLTQLT